MPEDQEMITVFRSAEMSAEEEATAVCELLLDNGLSAAVFGDEAPGVVAGSYEVRVPAAQAAQAERIIAAQEQAEVQPLDASAGLDLETIFSSDQATAELEALAVRGILDANGIPYVIVEAPAFPSLPVEIRVPKEHAGQALALISEARASGPEAAEEAEQATETGQDA